MFDFLIPYLLFLISCFNSELSDSEFPFVQNIFITN